MPANDAVDVGAPWDGRPLNPERSGWHWLQQGQHATPHCRRWLQSVQGWDIGPAQDEHCSPTTAAEWWTYLGPCHTPADIAAARAEGAEAMREACKARVRAEPEYPSDPPPEAVERVLALLQSDPVAGLRASVALTKRCIAQGLDEIPIPAADALALKPDMLRALPGGKIDDSTYEAIEGALDRIEAPLTDGKRWLTLPERIDALAQMAAPVPSHQHGGENAQQQDGAETTISAPSEPNALARRDVSDQEQYALGVIEARLAAADVLDCIKHVTPETPEAMREACKIAILQGGAFNAAIATIRARAGGEER